MRNQKLVIFDDTQIKAGTKWKEEIEKALASAKVAVLLVSSDFVASDFINTNELPPLLNAAEKEGLTIFWIPIRPSAYKQAGIGDYQAAYNPREPLARILENDPLRLEEILIEICENIAESARQ